MSVTLPAATLGIDGLVVRTGSVVHRLPAQVKLVSGLLFLIVVVSTGRGTWPALVLCGLLVVAALRLARLPTVVVLRRCVVEVPFLVFALLLPFVAGGDRVQVAGLSLSREGLAGAALLLAKSTLGVLFGVLLSATTSPRELLAGLARLRLPAPLIGILGFAIRYIGIAADDLRRAEVARQARGGAVGRLRALRSVAAGAGSVFVRTYERGERVHRSMLARGMSDGTRVVTGVGAAPSVWAAALAWPVTAAVALIAAEVMAT